MLRFTDVPGADFLWTLDLVATTLSFFGSLWMILCCLKAPAPKSLSLKLIASIGFADLFYSVANLLSNFETNQEEEAANLGAAPNPDDDDIDLCSYEAVLRQVFYTLSIYFSTCIAVASYYSVCPTKRFNKTLFFVIVHILALVIAALYVFVIPGFFEDDIVIAQGPFYCWYTYTTGPNVAMFTKMSLTLTFQALPVIVGLIVALVAYTLAIRKMNEIPEEFLEAYNINVYRVLWYPGILFLTFVPNVADCILRVLLGERPIWVNALHLLLTHSIGFNNALLYGIQTKLYKTNYEEVDTKATDLEDTSDNSYERVTYYSSKRKSSVRDLLTQAYSEK